MDSKRTEPDGGLAIQRKLTDMGVRTEPRQLGQGDQEMGNPDDGLVRLQELPRNIELLQRGGRCGCSTDRCLQTSELAALELRLPTTTLVGPNLGEDHRTKDQGNSSHATMDSMEPPRYT